MLRGRKASQGRTSSGGSLRHGPFLPHLAPGRDLYPEPSYISCLCIYLATCHFASNSVLLNSKQQTTIGQPFFSTVCCVPCFASRTYCEAWRHCPEWTDLFPHLNCPNQKPECSFTQTLQLVRHTLAPDSRQPVCRGAAASPFPHSTYIIWLLVTPSWTLATSNFSPSCLAGSCAPNGPDITWLLVPSHLASL